MSSRNSSKDENQLKDPLINDSVISVDKELPKKEGNWVAYALAAAILFTTCNTAFSELSSMGLTGMLYLSPGTLICGIVYFTYKLIDEYLNRRVCWTDLNLTNKDTGKVSWKNVGFIILYCLIYLSI